MEPNPTSRKLELEKLRIEGELRLREAELEVRRQEVEARLAEAALAERRQEDASKEDKSSKRITSSPLTIAIITGILSLIGAAVVNLLQSQATLRLERQKFEFTQSQEAQKNKADADLEQQKFKSNLILKAIETGEPASAAKNLEFLIAAKLIADPGGEIRRYITTPGKQPVLPRSGGSLLLSRSQDPLLTSGSGAVVRMRGGTYEHIDKAFVVRSQLRVSAGGSPKAYHPDSKLGLDFLSNAGREGRWWSIVTDSKGEPVVQGENDPAPGYYISQTSLQDRTKALTDPRRYVDSGTIPYIVIPSGLGGTAGNPRLGDLAAVYNKTNGKLAYAIVADIGPRSSIGEGSMALAEQLGVVSNPRTGGLEKEDIVMVVFPGSGNGSPQSSSEIQAGAAKLFEKWGGLTRLKSQSSPIAITDDGVKKQ